MMKKFCFMTSATRNEQFVVLKRQAKSLLEKGFDIYFCVSDNGIRETIDGITYLPTGYSGGGYLKRFCVLPRLMKKVALSIDADVYQIESSDFMQLGTLLKKKGKKVIYNMLESYPYTLYNKLKFPRIITHVIVAFITLKMKKALKKGDVVFAVSDDIISYLHGWGVHNAVLLGNYPVVDKNYQLTKEDYLNRDNRVIYYGHIPETSRQTNVIRAISKIPGVYYLIAGKFWNNDYLNRLKNEAGWEKVEFIDGFERSRLPEILSRCTICNTARDLSQSKSSNGSMGIIKIFESMEAALPIICVDVPVYRQLINEYHCGVLVDVNSVESFVSAIQYLVSHKEEAYQMG